MIQQTNKSSFWQKKIWYPKGRCKTFFRPRAAFPSPERSRTVCDEYVWRKKEAKITLLPAEIRSDRKWRVGNRFRFNFRHIIIITTVINMKIGVQIIFRINFLPQNPCKNAIVSRPNDSHPFEFPHDCCASTPGGTRSHHPRGVLAPRKKEKKNPTRSGRSTETAGCERCVTYAEDEEEKPPFEICSTKRIQMLVESEKTFFGKLWNWRFTKKENHFHLSSFLLYE